jgi:hypothetical protein
MHNLKNQVFIWAKSNPVFLLVFRAKSTVLAVLAGSAGQ